MYDSVQFQDFQRPKAPTPFDSSQNELLKATRQLTSRGAGIADRLIGASNAMASTLNGD